MSSENRCAIVGCGKDKLDLSGDTGPVYISRLYTSNYFELKREYAKECCDRYYILSAKHGLVAPDKAVTDPYDLTIDDLDGDALEEWADDVREVLRWFDGDATLVMLAGQRYLDPIRETLESRSFPPDVEYPFAETSGIGEQMGWLRDEIDAATAETPVEDPTDEQEGLMQWVDN
jgi:hypothetical protein